MPFVLLSLAALALAAGVIVLWLDQRQRAAHSAGDAATDTLTDTGASADVIVTDSADGAADAVAPEAAEPESAEPEATTEAFPEPEPEAEPELAEEPEPTVEPAIASEP